MALKGKLKTHKLSGGTQVIRVWRGLELSKAPTGAASRLILIDTKGEVPGDILCTWLGEVESERRTWEKNRTKEVTNNV